MEGKERRISERSLENLKLGAQSRNQGKVRQNFTLLPETLQWLKCSGNASSMIDDLVAIAKDGGLKSNNTHDRKTEKEPNSNHVYEQMEALKAELEQLRSERDQLSWEVNELHAKNGDLDLELTNLKEQQTQQQEQELVTPTGGKQDLEAKRDRYLASLKLGRQAPKYKHSKAAIDWLIDHFNP